MLLATTIVLVHGAWLNAASWQPFADRLRARGYDVVVPSWPHADGDPATLRAAEPTREDRRDQRKTGLDEIVEAYASVIEALPEPPILIGHSFGGLVVERLLDDGYGAVGVAIDPAPGKGIVPRPGALGASLPVLLHGGGVVQISERKFANTFANTLSDEAAAAAWEQLTVPTPSRPFFQVANAPFGHATRVHWSNDERAPLLVVAGTADRTVTPGMIHAAFRKYDRRSDAVTGWLEFRGRSHFLVAETGWEEVCDGVGDWIEKNLPANDAP